MDLTRLDFPAGIEQYKLQAESLAEAKEAGDSQAIQLIHHTHPRFLNPDVPWLPLPIPEKEIRTADFTIDDARLSIARWYNFRDWIAIEQFTEEVARSGSPVHRFESAVEAVVDGNAGELRSLIKRDPQLVKARSTRITHFDPPLHRSTLLHYVAANGVEGYRQRTPKNAVEIATILLQEGAEVDSLASLYGGECTTMTLLVSSCHPANAGVQVDLVNTLVEYGAAVEPSGSGNWASPLMTAIAFGYLDAAKALVRHGARVDTLSAAAGLGEISRAVELLPLADPGQRHRALAVSAQLGHVEIVKLLLDAGEDPNRFNPKDTHDHSLPIHQAIARGHFDVVRLLIERGAKLDIKDKVHHGTPFGWADYCGKAEIAKYLRSLGAE